MVTTLKIFFLLLVSSALCSALPVKSGSRIVITSTNTSSYELLPKISMSSAVVQYSNSPIATALAPSQTSDAFHASRPKPTMSTSAATSSSTSLNLQQQSGWNNGDISTVVFGCIASVLGVFALWATVWLGRRQSKYFIKNAPDDDSRQNLTGDPIVYDGGFALKCISGEGDCDRIPEMRIPVTSPPPAYIDRRHSESMAF